MSPLSPIKAAVGAGGRSVLHTSAHGCTRPRRAAHSRAKALLYNAAAGMPEPALTPLQDAATEVGLHPSTVRRYIRRGLLKGWRRGGDVRVYVDLAELRQLLEFKPAPPKPAEPYEPDPVTGPQNT